MLNLGIIGNCKTCALIDNKATIKWCCFPTFDSPSLFAKLLDDKKGGHFSIKTRGEYKVEQRYLEHSAILETKYTSPKAAFVVYDFFPRYRKLLPNKKKKLFRQNNLVRLIKPLKGKPFVRVEYEPKLNYARGENKTRVVKGCMVTRNGKHKIGLLSNVDYDLIEESIYFKLDHTKYFVIGDPKDSSHYNAAYWQRIMAWTKKYWKDWVSTLVLPEAYREDIIRSAITLKLLTFSETGAIIAAATTSIPEEIGSERTWDYRFCWVRDAFFTVDAFKRIGREYEAKKLEPSKVISYGRSLPKTHKNYKAIKLN